MSRFPRHGAFPWPAHKAAFAFAPKALFAVRAGPFAPKALSAVRAGPLAPKALSLSAQDLLPDLRDHGWQNLLHIPHNPVVRDLEDGRIGIPIDRNDALALAHAGEVLHGP